jgi:hypothetical protein
MPTTATERSASAILSVHGGQILYQDFDGVLHHENVLWHPRQGPHLQMGPAYHLFGRASLLAHLLTPYPYVQIVLSTAWVLWCGCETVARRLPEELRERVVGATYHASMNKKSLRSMPRRQQVLQDYGRRRPSAWLALDDDHLGWPHSHSDKLIEPIPRLGSPCRPY